MNSVRQLTQRSPRTSPLRYPGGKQLLAPYVAGVIEENFLTGCAFYEPFAGGAAVSLELLRLGYVDTATLFERDPLVYAFWWCLRNEFDGLLSAIEAADVTLNAWKAMAPLREVDDPATSNYSLLELGAAGLFFNRTNFSGVLGAGPIGGMSQTSKYKIDCRFNKKTIAIGLRALRPLCERLTVRFGDSLAWLKDEAPQLSISSSFVYVDPPYYGQGRRLYRHHFSNSQHAQLADLLKPASFPWLLSYDDAPFIRELYKGSKLQPIYLDHSVKSSRLAQEVVISNLEIPPPVYQGYAVAELSNSHPTMA